jgi:hypothetical protein
MYVKPINVSNTTLSTYKSKRHRKFDVKQSKRHNFGQAHCVICDEVFTKYAHNTKACSIECKTERKKVYTRKWRKENREKLRKRNRKYREENGEKILAYQHKYREENREKIRAKAQKKRRAKSD